MSPKPNFGRQHPLYPIALVGGLSYIRSEDARFLASIDSHMRYWEALVQENFKLTSLAKFDG